jgi:hypothetical protein
MFKLHNPTKTEDLSAYLVHSHDCPVCHTSTSVLIAPEKLYAYNQGAYAQEVLSEYDPAIVERFITGLCGECWSSLFSDEEDIHQDCYADQCLADTSGTIDNECRVANA